MYIQDGLHGTSGCNETDLEQYHSCYMPSIATDEGTELWLDSSYTSFLYGVSGYQTYLTYWKLSHEVGSETINMLSA